MLREKCGEEFVRGGCGDESDPAVAGDASQTNLVAKTVNLQSSAKKNPKRCKTGGETLK
jgi:hypothetical protein